MSSSQLILKMADSTNYSTTTTCTAGTLFKDGIYAIYQYLPLEEVCRCAHISRRWMSYAHTIPLRQLNWPVHHPWTNRELPPTSFAQHFTTITGPKKVPSHVEMSVDELKFCVDRFNNLTKIQCVIKPGSLDIMNSQEVHWQQVPSLTTLSIHFGSCVLPNLLRSIGQITWLKILKLSSLPRFCNEQNSPDWIHPLVELSRLSSLVDLTITKPDTVLSTYQLPTQVLSSLPPSITALDLDETILYFYEMPKDVLPNLSYYRFPRLTANDLRWIHSERPRLCKLAPQEFAPNDYHLLGLFKELKEVRFSELDAQLPDQTPSVLEGLKLSNSLITIRFEFLCEQITQPHVWTELSSYLPNITDIHFNDIHGEVIDILAVGFGGRLKKLSLFPNIRRRNNTLPVDSLSQFSVLEELTIYHLDHSTIPTQPLTTHANEVADVRAHFSSSSILPQLHFFRLIHQVGFPNNGEFIYSQHAKINTNNYRTD